MPRKRTASLTLSKDELTALRTLAKSHGFVIGRGAYREMGSINQLLSAIAAGDLHVSQPPATSKTLPKASMTVVFVD